MDNIIRTKGTFLQFFKDPFFWSGHEEKKKATGTFKI
jgi:hypothetical protein